MGKVIKISEINIVPVKPNRGLIGFASFVMDKQFFMGGIAIFSKPQGGIRLVYPKKNGVDCFYPISKKIGDYICTAVEQEFSKIIKI